MDNLYFTKQLFCSVLFCSVLFCSVLFCSVLFCSVLFCSVLFCSVLFCSVLFCSALFCSDLTPVLSSSCPLSPVVSKASAGAMEITDIFEINNLPNFLQVSQML